MRGRRLVVVHHDSRGQSSPWRGRSRACRECGAQADEIGIFGCSLRIDSFGQPPAELIEPFGGGRQRRVLLGWGKGSGGFGQRREGLRDRIQIAIQLEARRHRGGHGAHVRDQFGNRVRQVSVQRRSVVLRLMAVGRIGLPFIDAQPRQLAISALRRGSQLRQQIAELGVRDAGGLDLPSLRRRATIRLRPAGLPPAGAAAHQEQPGT